MEEFKYFGVLFTSEGRMEREIDTRAVQRLQSCGRRGGKRAELKGKALDLLVY